jgi:transposase InsO family protein
MENFFHTLKQELVYSLNKPSRKIMKQEVFRYIEGFYNKERLHSSIDYMSPKKYLEKIQQQLKIN